MEEQQELPQGWELVSLDAVAKTITGNTPPKNDEANYGRFIPLIKPTELKNCLVSEAADGLSEADAKLARVLPVGSVLVSCIGNLGKTGFNTVPVAFNQQINAAVFTQAVEAKLGFYYFQSSAAREYLQSVGSSTTIDIVNKSKFDKTPFPLPPLPEQRRIVAKLEELFSKLDAGVAAVHWPGGFHRHDIGDSHA